LGFPVKFGLSAAEITKRYYELSRIFHPDRFRKDSRSGVALAAEELMSELNEAFETLRDPSARRQYLVRGHLPEETLKQKGLLPMELAERWFEIQEAVQEKNPSASLDLQTFRDDLSHALEEIEEKILNYEKQYDIAEGAEALTRIHQETLKQNVLQSLERDVNRLKVGE
jgi:molecular chaperone HscB